MEIDQSRKIMILGDSGWGKTTLMLSIINELASRWHVYIYNTDFEQFPITNMITPMKPDINNVSNVEYLSLVIDRMRAKFKNYVFVITDLDKFFESTSPMSKISDSLKDLYGTGRHQRILVIVETKQPRYIPSKLLANSNLFYIGKFTEQEDIRRLKGYISAEEMAQLQKHEFWEYDKNTGNKRKVKVMDGEIQYLEGENNDGM